MIWLFLAFIGGLFLGWNLPQPIWAEELQERILLWIETLRR